MWRSLLRRLSVPDVTELPTDIGARWTLRVALVSTFVVSSIGFFILIDAQRGNPIAALVLALVCVALLVVLQRGHSHVVAWGVTLAIFGIAVERVLAASGPFAATTLLLLQALVIAAQTLSPLSVAALTVAGCACVMIGVNRLDPSVMLADVVAVPPLVRAYIVAAMIFGTGALLTVHAIVSHRLRRRLIEQNDLERLAALGRLSASIAHEMATPSSVISLNVNTMRRAFDDLWRALEATATTGVTIAGVPFEQAKPDITRTQRHIDGAVASIVALNEQLKAFSRPQTGARAPIDLNAAIEQALLLVEPSLRKHAVEVRLELGAQLGLVVANDRQLGVVLLGLLTDAAESYGAVRSDSRTLVIRTFADEPAADVCCSLTSGRPNSDVATLFATDIVRALGGKMSSQASDAGATTTLRLPRI